MTSTNANRIAKSASSCESQVRTAIVIDYQNLHLTAHGLFDRYRPPHESLIHPGQYAKNLIQR
ncbi:hypothetical protein, partial [Brevibacterium sp. FAM 25378]|uniref:hypothetical protein n=1 Tax=Brevibacterium sp. FAM 25378 TaxID=3415682 RepID=UPI003C7B0C4D